MLGYSSNLKKAGEINKYIGRLYENLAEAIHKQTQDVLNLRFFLSRCYFLVMMQVLLTSRTCHISHLLQTLRPTVGGLDLPTVRQKSKKNTMGSRASYGLPEAYV